MPFFQKKHPYKKDTTIILCILFIQDDLFAQCDDRYESELLRDLEYGFEKKAFIVLNGSRNIQIEHPIELEAGVTYQICLRSADGGTKGLLASMYNEADKRKLTTYYKGKFYQTVTYYCQATGIYRFVFEFKNSKKHCGAALLSFKNDSGEE